MKKKKILIAPGSADCNRGDQALIWTAISLIEDICEHNVEIKLMSDAEHVETDQTSCQTNRLGYSFCRTIVDNPNRVLKESTGFSKSFFDFARVACCSIIDFFYYGLVLSVARKQKIVYLLLSKEKYETFKYIKGLDAFIVKGGGFIYSYRNISYAYYLWYVCYHILLAQRLSVPVVIFPNSFGPFETTFSRWFTSRLLNNCALVAARESKSKEILDILVPKKTRQFPDMAFLLKTEPKDSEWARNELANLGVNIDGSAVGITMRPWRFPDHAQPKAAYNAYIDSMAEFIRYLQTQNLQPILFVHVRGPGLHETDKLAIDDCLLKLKDNHPIVVDNEYNCIQMMALYSYLGYMIGTRFHSCIFSMVKSIPTLAIGYQGYKASGIMSDIGLDEYFLDINNLSVEILIDKFFLLKRQEKDVRIKYANYLHKIEQEIADMFNHVSMILKKETFC